VSAGAYADYTIKLHHAGPADTVSAALSAALWLPAIGLTGTFLILLFPDGHLPGPRWRSVAWTSAVGIVVASFCLMFTPGPLDDGGYPNVPNPLGIDAIGVVLDTGKLTILLVLAMMVASAASLVVRYRRARGGERQQLKWLATAAAVVAVTYAIVEPLSALVAPSSGSPPTWLAVAQNVAILSFALIPAAIAVAVLRYRLYEIDVIIRRTLVYAALIATLAVVYLSGVALVGGLLRTVTGGSGAVGDRKSVV